MKATSTISHCTDQSALYMQQARNRERARFDFQIAMDFIGGEFRELRIRKGLALETVARAVKMSKYRLCMIEHGMYIHFDVPQMRRLAAYYGVSHLQILAAIPDTQFSDFYP